MVDPKNLTLAENAKTQGKHLSIFLADCGRNLGAMLAFGHKLWTGSEEEMGP